VDLELKLDELIVQRLPVDGDRSNRGQILTKNRLCALADQNQSVLGLAIIRSFDADKQMLRLRTPVSSRSIRILQLGDELLE